MRSSSMHSNAELEKHLAIYPELVGKEGRVKSKWCSGCHYPALMLAGTMTEQIDRTTAQAGLTCLACHAIDRIHDQTGNGNYKIADEQEDPYLFAESRTGVRGFLHDTALKARPAVHKRQMLKPFFRTSEFCATCHKVSLDARVNDYRWLRGQDEYDNWHDSVVARNASRTFYLPLAARVCQDCHMSREPAPLGDVSVLGGTVRSHRFLAVNTALPYLRGDQETVDRIEQFLQDQKLRVDIFALKAAGQTHYAVDRRSPSIAPGTDFEVDVVVRNKGVGHTFPGGTNDGPVGHSIRLRLRGKASNLDAIGTMVTATTGNLVQQRLVRTGSSYLSHRSTAVNVGIGVAESVDRVQIEWSDGSEETIESLPAQATYWIEQSGGIVRRRAFRAL